MLYQSFLIKYAEIGTKGKNRFLFEDALIKQIKHALRPVEGKFIISKESGRIYMDAQGEYDYDEVIAALKRVFGIAWICPMFQIEKTDFEEIKKEVASYVDQVYEDKNFTFKVDAKRVDKKYPVSSEQMNRDLGEVILDTFPETKVDVHHPEMLVTVEIRHDAIYVMTNVIKGAGGYPVGIGGKALLMLSGGIDSPVAGYLTLKRGVDIECVHFAAPPYTNEFAREKVFDLVDKLRHYTHGQITVHVVNFTKLQLAVYDHCDESYAMTVMRRMMYRIGEKLAIKNHCLALVNGESIGQVASQTLDSMNVINQVISIPVLRPVLCLDKLEIIDIAQKIDTYDISIRPHEDCCTIFTPKAPATKPKSYKAEAFEATFDYETYVNECVENVETIVVDANYKNDEDIF